MKLTKWEKETQNNTAEVEKRNENLPKKLRSMPVAEVEDYGEILPTIHCKHLAFGYLHVTVELQL